MEGHAFAKLDFPGGVVERLIGGGEPRREALVLVRKQQRLEHVTPHGVVRPKVMVVRVERRRLGRDSNGRSEEHTSELQSLMRISYAVFCLNKKTHKQIGDKTKHNI